MAEALPRNPSTVNSVTVDIFTLAQTGFAQSFLCYIHVGYDHILRCSEHGQEFIKCSHADIPAWPRSLRGDTGLLVPLVTVLVCRLHQLSVKAFD